MSEYWRPRAEAWFWLIAVLLLRGQTVAHLRLFRSLSPESSEQPY
jgi:hypothetical protein